MRCTLVVPTRRPPGADRSLRFAARWLLDILHASLAPLLLLVPLTACNADRSLDSLIPPQEAAEGQKIMAQLAAQDAAGLESRLDSSLKTPQARQSITQMVTMMPKVPPRSVATIGFSRFRGETDERYGFVYEYEYDTTWMVANLVFSRKAGQLFIEGLHIAFVPQSQKAIHAFALQGKGPLHYAFLAAASAVPLFILGTLVVCYRTNVARRKWLWYLFILLGVVQFQLNWTTGTLSFQLIAFTLLGAGFWRASDYAPLFLSFSIPLGAIVFLARRKVLGPRAETRPTLTPEASAP